MGRYSPEAMEAKRKKNFDLWLSKAINIHGSRFDYAPSKKTFVRQKAVLSIHCNAHQIDFEISAFDHLRYHGGGCPRCEFEHRSVAQTAKGDSTFDEFFRLHLKDRLDLLSKYEGMRKPIRVRCKLHQLESEVIPNALVYSGAWACPVCAKKSVASKSRLTIHSLRAMYQDVLPKHIRILGVEHEPNKATKVTVTCDTHGESKVLVGYLRRSANQRGYFCPKCGDENIGYAGYRLRRLIEHDDVGKPTWIGVMEVEVFGLNSLKVGVSTRPLIERYGADLKTIFFSAKLPEREALLIENEVHRKFHAYSDKRILNAGMRDGKRWSGDTECYYFKAKEEILALIEARLEEVERKTFDLKTSLSEFVEPDFSERDVTRPKGIRNCAKPVVCLDTEDWFPSLTEAALWAGCSQGNLSAALRGVRRVAGGYRWMWASEFERLTEMPALPEKRIKRRKVLRVQDGKVFESITAAARACGLSSSHITGVCKGTRKSAGGFIWRYLDE